MNIKALKKCSKCGMESSQNPVKCPVCKALYTENGNQNLLLQKSILKKCQKCGIESSENPSKCPVCHASYTENRNKSLSGIKEIRHVWRILAGIIICQFIGSFIGLLITFHHYWFANLWAGAVIAAPVGFVIGVWWQFQNPERRISTSKSAIFFYGFLAVMLAIFGIFVEMPRLKNEMNRLHILSSLKANMIERIIISDEHGKTKQRIFDSRKSLSEFADACSDVSGHSPNHPQYISSWFLIIEGTERHEFIFHFDPEFPGQIVGDFVKRSGQSTWHYGTFIILIQFWFFLAYFLHVNLYAVRINYA